MPEPGDKEIREAILNSFTTAEAHRLRQVLAQYGTSGWLAPLLARVGPESGWTRGKSGWFFELRFAGELCRLGIHAVYECSGSGDRTIDFCFESGGFVWRVELVGPRASDAVGRALDRRNEEGLWSITLSSDNKDQRQSHGGELLRLQGIIAEKASKFETPVPGSYNVLAVDTRRVGLTGVDDWDAKQLAYGPAGIPPEYVNSFDGAVVRGLFEPDVPLKMRATFQDRVHFIVLVADEQYAETSLLTSVRALHNPHLFGSEEEARSVFAKFPNHRMKP